MRLHAKLLGNNPFCTCLIWLVYCTFTCTERVKYTLCMGSLLLNQDQTDASFLSLLQKIHVVPTTRTAESGPQVPKASCSTWVWLHLSLESCWMSIFSHPVQISQYGTILHLRCIPHSQQQTTRTMVNGKERKPQRNKTEKDARGLTRVYFLSYHSLKLLSNSIKKRQNRSIPSRRLLRTISYPQLNFNALFHKHNICYLFQ